MSDMQNSDVAFHKVTKGMRSYFLDDANADQLMTFMLELMTEVIVLKDKNDLLERFLSDNNIISREALMDYVPSPEAEAERTKERADLVKRVLRIHQPEGR